MNLFWRRRGEGEDEPEGAAGGIKGEIIGAVWRHNLRLITLLRSPPTSDRRLLPFAVVGASSAAAAAPPPRRRSSAAAHCPQLP